MKIKDKVVVDSNGWRRAVAGGGEWTGRRWWVLAKEKRVDGVFVKSQGQDQEGREGDRRGEVARVLQVVGWRAEAEKQENREHGGRGTGEVAGEGGEVGEQRTLQQRQEAKRTKE